IDRNKQAVIEAACGKLGIDGLKPLKDALPPEITYDEIRLVVARVRREQRVSKVDVPAEGADRKEFERSSGLGVLGSRW
ncbi:MAG: helix-turn-helix domain-containing protein, partial [Candidatus Sulfotelmatobacter sp.]